MYSNLHNARSLSGVSELITLIFRLLQDEAPDVTCSPCLNPSVLKIITVLSSILIELNLLEVLIMLDDKMEL